MMRQRILVLASAAAVSLAAGQTVSDLKVVNDRAPDCSSLKAIVRSVTTDCKTDDERVIAIYNVCRYLTYHHAYPSEAGGIGALKFYNVYGWGLCGGQHAAMAALWDAAGYKHRFVGWRGHTTVEVFYNDGWHYLDTFLKFYTWMPDANAPGGRTIASQDAIAANPGLVRDALIRDPARKVCYFKNNRFAATADGVNWRAPALLVCGDTINGVLSGIQTRHGSGSPRGWGAIRFDEPAYATSVNLGPGYALTLNWASTEGAYYFRGHKQGPHHTCGDKDFRNCPAIGPLLEPYLAQGRARSWSNGELVFRPDLHSDAFLGNLASVDNVTVDGGAMRPAEPGRPGTIVVEMASPYVVAKASGKLRSADATTEVSLDGKLWQAIDPNDFSQQVAGAYRYRVRIRFTQAVTALELTSVVQHNQEALPYLAPGRNRITVSAADTAATGDNRVLVTYAYCPGSRNRTPAQICQAGAEIARAHYASWREEPVVVQRIVDRFPCEFEILVPTPKDQQPVYPRMLFLRREVLAPGQRPLPTPAPPSVPRVEPGEALLSLPPPWTVGAAPPPPPAPRRDTETVTLQPIRTLYADKAGKVYPWQFIKWLKDDSNAWILLLAFDPAKLPAADELATATLAFYVHEAHNKAPMQAAAVALTAPFKEGEAYDFQGLGRQLGTVTVGRGNGPGDPFVPPKRYEIDVTAEVRAWIEGKKPYGMALRIVPNRSIDDGWTVRFTPAKVRPAELEVATFKPASADRAGDRSH